MQTLWQRLEQFFAAQQWPVALRPGASEAEIARVEQALGLPFPTDFRARCASTMARIGNRASAGWIMLCSGCPLPRFRRNGPHSRRIMPSGAKNTPTSIRTQVASATSFITPAAFPSPSQMPTSGCGSISHPGRRASPGR